MNSWMIDRAALRRLAQAQGVTLRDAKATRRWIDKHSRSPQPAA
jgi:hypothetical protein